MNARYQYTFGRYRLDARGRVLFRNEHRLHLTPRAIDVLIVLVEAGGEPVTKDELLQTVWKGVVVSEGSLTFHISMLRKILQGRYIETLPKRGYRFAGAVNRCEPSAPRREIRSLAVLPLTSLSRGPSAARCTEAITEALTMSLTQLRPLRVASRTSVMHYRDSRQTLREIGKELNVDALVEGAVQLEGRRIQINVRLVGAADDQSLWADSYDRDLGDVLKLQNEVARAIAQQIQLKLTSVNDACLSSARTIDPDAYHLCIEGRHLWVKRTEESVNRAISCFEKAISIDPHYAAAHSGVADCYSSLGFSFDIGSHRPTEIQPRARAAAERALLLDESLADAHNSLAYVRLNYDWDWIAAEREFKRSLELNPGYAHAHHWYAHLLLSDERADEALAESQRALQLEPLSPVMNLHLGWHYWYARDYDAALEQLARTLELEPNYGLAYWYRGLSYAMRERYNQALRELGVARRLLKSSLMVEADIGYVYAVAGEKKRARDVIGTLKKKATRRYLNPFQEALIHVGLGDKESAFACLESAFKERSDILVYTRVDPRLDPLRDDPRFRALERCVRGLEG